ncbi:MAG: hypothetical protein L6R39_004637 [Caloplaca ligustica]|nr:MAG: hypothetical protein L6R39_004637 [Caloplaca ligustica]
MLQPVVPYGFLSLPRELRDQIYEYVLSSNAEVMEPYDLEEGLVPAIIRTCKQVESEGCAVLYTKYTYLFNIPPWDLEWLTTIGKANVMRLKTIRIVVAPTYWKSLWYRLLHSLARDAKGLRHVYIFWDCDDFDGIGKDVRFVRELGAIQHPESTTVDGYYGLHWPGYLTDKMNARFEKKTASKSTGRV